MIWGVSVIVGMASAILLRVIICKRQQRALDRLDAEFDQAYGFLRGTSMYELFKHSFALSRGKNVPPESWVNGYGKKELE